MLSENEEDGFESEPSGQKLKDSPSPVSATSITDDLVLDCLKGDASAWERLYLGSVRWLNSIIREKEGLNTYRWGTVITDDLAHDVVSRTVGPDGSGLARFAGFRKPAAGYLKSLKTAFKRRLINSHRRWEAKERLHLGPLRGPEALGDGPAAPPLDRIASLFPNPDEEAAANDLLSFIRRIASTTLSEEDCRLLYCDIDGEPRPLVAARLGIQEKSIAVRICRIRKKLHEAMVKELQSPKTFSDT